MAIATAQDVETSLMRSLHESEAQYVEKLLNRAENLIKVRIPKLAELCNASPSFMDLLTQVEAEAVARIFRAENSGIYTSESEDGYSYRLNLKVASGLLDILPEEWARLMGTGGFRSVAPVSDGYARARLRGQRPDLNFQFGWPGKTLLSEEL
ncbi:hypothetical protein E4U03_11300 [Rothia nasimurium]|uniref:Uncharacterized protein n=1 Tax=Rothia nasimurium TaxID=85336 RepID=A0A4Y9F0J9_9MICC|nr:Gp19/Gp15/Gp42 family protein [Rothia nasimurium]MBF0809185.1 hypothetical protein [Rothia nasimurium]TFU20534.1 hypothetical protein E4U03_11300 [Rothia nasimurium]